MVVCVCVCVCYIRSIRFCSLKCYWINYRDASRISTHHIQLPRSPSTRYINGQLTIGNCRNVVQFLFIYNLSIHLKPRFMYGCEFCVSVNVLYLDASCFFLNNNVHSSRVDVAACKRKIYSLCMYLFLSYMFSPAD